MLLSETASLCDIQSVSVTDSLCVWETICVCERQSVSATDSMCLSQTIFVCHRQSLSVTDMLCLPQTVCFCHKQSMSIKDSCCLSQKFFVRHKRYVSVTDSMPFCIFFKQSSWSFFAWFLTTYLHMIFIISFLVCPKPWNQQNQLCGPMAREYSCTA